MLRERAAPIPLPCAGAFRLPFLRRVRRPTDYAKGLR